MSCSFAGVGVKAELWALQRDASGRDWRTQGKKARVRIGNWDIIDLFSFSLLHMNIADFAEGRKDSAAPSLPGIRSRRSAGR